MNDEEKAGQTDHSSLNGHPAVADFIASDPDHETYVFRKFNRLTARNLVTLQGELVGLEDELRVLDREAGQTTDRSLLMSMRSWQKLRETAKHRMEEKKRLDLATRIEARLKSYHEALLLASNIAALESPSKRVLQAFEQTLHSSPDADCKLGGSEARILDDVKDLVALRPPADKDVLSRTLRNHWPFPTKARPSTDTHRIRHFDEHRLVQVISAISILITGLLIIGPILALNFTTNANARLGIAVAFILLFASGLSLSTGVSRDNVFIATATYSAVLVVFVSGNLGNVGNVSSSQSTTPGLT